jgi:hypothetical protein
MQRENLSLCTLGLLELEGFAGNFLLNFLLSPQLVLPIQIMMVAVAVGVRVHILKLPTLGKRRDREKIENVSG